MKNIRFSVIGALGLACALTLSGCSSIEGIVDAVSGDAAKEMLSTPAGEPIWQVDIQTAGEGPRLVGDTVVTYVLKDDALTLAGFDTKTGTEKWTYSAGTGTVSNEYPLRLRFFKDKAGKTFVLNVLDPIKSEPDENGEWWLRHPLQVIDVNTGADTMVPEKYYVGPDYKFSCLTDTMSCFSGRIEGEQRTVGITADGTTTDNPAAVIIPEYEYIGWATEDGMIRGMSKEDGPSTGRQRDGKLEWSIPLAKVGLKGLTKSDSSMLFEGDYSGVYFFTNDGEMITDDSPADIAVTYNRKIDTGEFKSDTGDTHTVAFDMNTNKKLWEATGEMCFANATVLCTGETTIDDSGEVAPADRTLWGFDPKTGEELWSTEVTNFEIEHGSFAGLLPDSDLRMIKNADGMQILNVSDGTLTPLSEDESYGCTATNGSFAAPQWSNPSRPTVSWDKNEVAASCSLSGESTDPADFSQMAVAFNSGRPFDIRESDWDPLKKQVRVVSTTSGLTAYDF